MSDPFDDFDDPPQSRTSYRGGRAGYKSRIVRPIPPPARLAAGGAGRAVGAFSAGEVGTNVSGNARTEAGGAGGQGEVAGSGEVGKGEGGNGGQKASKDCTRIATFMFKGGVYKTMTTIMAASALSCPPYNKRVLIVDADSQCNTTSFFMPEPKNWQSPEGVSISRQNSHTDVEAGGAGGSAGGVEGGAKSKISLSEKHVLCHNNDALTEDYFKRDTWLETADSGKKMETLLDLLFPDFDQGRGSSEMADPSILPVSHFPKKFLPGGGYVICQKCSTTRTMGEAERSNKELANPWRCSNNDWFCSHECEDNRMQEHTLFLLPGSTKLSSLESRMSEENGTSHRMFAAFDKLFKKLSDCYDLDYIFVDLGPNHGKLNMAFALSCHAILPPLHADFYSATSMSRMLEDKGVLCQWDDWRRKFVDSCADKNLDAGPYVKMPNLLPFLVSGYDTARKKRSNSERPRMPEHKGGFECGKVLKEHAIFVASMRLVVEDDTIPNRIRGMFLHDGDTMVVPFCRALKNGIGPSQAIGVPQHQIFEADLQNFFDYAEPTSHKVYAEGKEDFSHADDKFCCGAQTYAAAKRSQSAHDKVWAKRFEELQGTGGISGKCLSSFLEHFATSCHVGREGGEEDKNGDEDGTGNQGGALLLGEGRGGAPPPEASGGDMGGADADDVDSDSEVQADERPKSPFLSPVEPGPENGVPTKCVVFGVYNYKGGVGKTSTAIQLAATLAKMGSKVCLIDADGQCNCTAFFHPALKFDGPAPASAANLDASQRIIPADELPHGTRACPVDSFKPMTWLSGGSSYDFNANNINGMLAPVFDGNADVAQLKAPKLLSVDPEFYKGNLLLLPGSVELSNVSLTSGVPSFECRRFGVFRKMFSKIAQSYSTPDSPMKFIIIDLGPSVDDLNKAFVMSSDYILPPANADYFSASSVRGLLYEVLPSFCFWRQLHQVKMMALGTKTRNTLKEDGYYGFEEKEWPKVLPFLVSCYQLESGKSENRRDAKGKKKMAVKNQIEQVSADFIHSIRILIRGCTDPANIDSDDWQALPASMIVHDKDGHAAVPFCHHLPIAPSVSHRSGVAAVHLEDHKVNFKKHGKEVGAGEKGNTGQKESRFAKERFETLALFVKEQRRICLRDRYKLVPGDISEDEDNSGGSGGDGSGGDGGDDGEAGEQSDSKRTQKRSRDPDNSSRRKSARLHGEEGGGGGSRAGGGEEGGGRGG